MAAKKSTSAASAKPEKVAARKPEPAGSTPVRNSAVPPKAAARKAVPVAVTHETIAKRAYEIHLSGKGGSEQDDWFQAERELRGA